MYVYTTKLQQTPMEIKLRLKMALGQHIRLWVYIVAIISIKTCICIADIFRRPQIHTKRETSNGFIIELLIAICSI